MYELNQKDLVHVCGERKGPGSCMCLTKRIWFMYALIQKDLVHVCAYPKGSGSCMRLSKRIWFMYALNRSVCA